MWNYSFVMPNLMALSVFFVYYLVRPRLPLKINSLFPNVILIETFLILIDPISSLLLERGPHYPLLLQRIANSVFFVLFILRSCIFAVLTANLLKVHVEKKVFPFAAIVSVLAVGEVLALLSVKWNVFFFIDSDGYHRGRLYFLIYVFAFFYLAFSFLMIFMRRRSVEPWRLRNTLVFNSVLLVGYIARIYLKGYLIMDSFCLLAIIIIYSKVESSALYFDARSGVFNNRALFDKLEELAGSSDVFIMGFSLKNFRDMKEIFSNRQLDVGLGMIGLFLLKNFSNLTSFYIGGGMFVLLCESSCSYEDVRDRLKERFSNYWSDGEDLSLLLHVGFARFERNIQIKDSELIIKAAVAALSKAGLVNCDDIVVTEGDLDSISEKIEVKKAVEKAVVNKSTMLFLQPIMEAKTFRLAGAEALARIRGEDGNVIPPGIFIPIAEQNGRINFLGEQMFEKTCDFIRAHDIKAKGLAWINVNLSPVQFLMNDLNKRFSDILGNYGLNADVLHLEITEESMVDYALLQSQIQMMTGVGFKFVLDDYGKGYSNVSRLKKCPFVNVKLDMEIVWDYFKTEDSIVPMLVKAFKEMGFSVTAEGIETEEMAVRMRDLGCDYLQGYYFSKPLSADEFVEKYLT